MIPLNNRQQAPWAGAAIVARSVISPRGSGLAMQDIAPKFMQGNGGLLLVEPSAERRNRLAGMLAGTGNRLEVVESRKEALKVLAVEQIAVVVTAPRLPDGFWTDLVNDSFGMPASPSIVVAAGESATPSKAEVAALGGYGLLPKDPLEGDVCIVIRQAVQHWARRNFSENVPHVLVVDDERMIRELIVRILEPNGMTVKTARDGRQAVELARTDSAISVAILDWRLPGISGELVYDELAAIRPGIKAIVASASMPLEVEQAFRGRKVEAFLGKPFYIERLLETVKTALAT